MKGINKVAKIVAKIVEVSQWVAVVLMIAAAICSLIAPSWVKHFVGYDAKECCGAELSIYGFEITAKVTDGMVNKGTFILFAISSIIIFTLMALIFRNLYLIIKKSEKSTPFQKDNIRMLNEIGILSMSIPCVGLVMSIIVRLICGVDVIETSVNSYGFVMGIIVLCLTQFFTRGVELERDVDGLL